jgi:hypothetical protein
MAERSPIFSAKIDNQRIGYIEHTAAFDLLGNKRCNYNPNTGNLLELESGRTIGHISLAGHFVGVSRIADELFPQPDAITPPVTPPDGATSDSAEPSFHWAIAKDPGALSTSPKAAEGQVVPATSRDEPVMAVDPITLIDSSRETTDTRSTSLARSLDEPVSADLTTLTTCSDEPSASGAVASLTTSLDEPVATNSVTLAPSSDVEAPLSGDAERALEMIRVTLAMKFTDTNNQTATDIATQMRDHIARTRKKAPRARLTIRYSMKGFDNWNTSGNTSTK